MDSLLKTLYKRVNTGREEEEEIQQTFQVKNNMVYSKRNIQETLVVPIVLIYA